MNGTEINQNETLIAFLNSEKRCQGFFEHVKTIDSAYIFVKEYPDDHEPELEGAEIIDCTQDDALSVVSKVSDIIKSSNGIINVDVSSMKRVEFLYFLRMSDNIGRYEDLRLLYSEPEDYLTDEYQNPSIGIEKISSVPGFINKTPLNKPLLLIMLLGYEPARSLAIYNNIDPDRTYLIVPHPPYNEQWKGRTERKNSNLINTVKEDRVERMHSYDVNQFVQEFSNFIANEDIDLNQWNCLISPLSTKPQTLGLFNYWRENKGAFSLIHSTPLKYNKLFKPTGISKRHIIKDANP